MPRDLDGQFRRISSGGEGRTGQRTRGGQRRKGTGGSHTKGTKPEHGLHRCELADEGGLTFRWLYELGYCVPLAQTPPADSAECDLC
eukprot:2389154-Pyramimonas_sp.AAC.1